MDESCIIFGAAPTEAAALSGVLPSDALILCADGGLMLCYAMGFTPDRVIGDGDSLTDAPSGVPQTLLPKEKDQTDLHACVETGLSLGCKAFWLLGCTGGRLDHFWSAVSLLELLHHRGAKGYVLNSDNEIQFTAAQTTFFQPPHQYQYLSVLPLDEIISGVTLTGVKYPLTDATLHRADSFSVSNEPLAGQTASVTISKGCALIVRSGIF